MHIYKPQNWLFYTIALTFLVANSFAATYFSQGTAVFSSTSNWNTTANGSGTNPVAGDLTSGVHSFVVQTGHTVTVDLNPVMVNFTNSGNLVIGDNTTGRTLTITGTSNISAGASMTVGAADASHSLVLRGNMVNNGTVNLYNTSSSNASVTWSGTSVNLSGAGGFSIGTLILSAPSGTTTLTLNSSATINGSVSLPNACTLNDGGLTHFVGGDWIEAGTGALTGLGTIDFNNSTFQQVTSAAVFNNLRASGGGVLLLSAAVTANGNVTIVNNSTIQTNTTVTHIFNGDLLVDATAFYTQTAGTLTFAASTRTQTVPTLNCSYSNLTFSNGGATFPKTINGDLTLLGLLTISANAQLNTTGNNNLTGAIGGGGIRQDGICNCTGSFNFSGSNAQTISSLSASANVGSASIFANGSSITFSAVSPTPSVTWNINNDLTVNSGTITLNNNVILSGQSGFTYSLNNNSIMNCRGANNFPTGFGNLSLATTSTVQYDQNFAQVVRGGISYGNLTLSQNTKTIDADLTVLGNLSLASNVTANLVGFNVSIAGNFTNNAGCSFINNQTVNLNAADADQNISGTGSFSYNNLVFTSDATTALRTKSFGNNFSVSGDFTATNLGGTSTNLLVLNLSTFTITNSGSGSFNLGDFVRINTTGLSNFRSSMLTFGNRNLSQNSTVGYMATAVTPVVQLISSDVVYGNLEIGGSGTGNYKAACGNLTILGNFQRSGSVCIFRDSSFSVSIAGNYTLGTADYPNPSAASTFTFNGDFQTIGTGSNNANLPNVIFAGTGTKQFNASSNYTVNVFGNLTINTGITVDANNKNLSITGNFINPAGVFTQTATTTFNSTTAPQSITTNSSSNFGNLTINKPTATLANRVVTLNTTTNLSGNLVLTADAAQLDGSNLTLNVGGSWTLNSNSSFISTNGTVNFNGSSVTQNITHNAANSFNTVLFTGNATKSFGGTAGFTALGDFNITNSTVQGNNVPISVGGNVLNNGTFSHSNTLTLNGANQTVSGLGLQYYNLIAAGTGTKTFAGSVNIVNIFTINSGVTVDLTSSNNPLTIGGNYTNNGSLLVNNSTVTFSGGAKTIITGGTGAGKFFYNLVFNATAGTTQTISTNDILVTNDLTITSGTVSPNTSNITVGGNFVVGTDGVFSSTNNTSPGSLTLNASSGSKIFQPGPSPSTYRAITINAPSATYTLQTHDLTIGNSRALTITAGRFTTSSRSITMTNGNVLINGGTFGIDAGGQLFLANGASITNNGGTFLVLGTATNNAFIRRNGASGGYTINQTAGNLQARFYTIENIGTTGFTISGTSVIDATNNLSNGVFTGGSGTQYLNLSGYNFADFTVNNVQFSTGPTYNVSRTSGTGVITLNGSTGSLSGEAFDNDPGETRVNWTSAAKRWTGLAGDNSWNTAGNWSPTIVPSSSDTVYLDHSNLSAAYTVNIDAANANAGRLIIDRGDPANNPITLVLASGRTLTVAENINILSGCTFTQTNSTSILSVGGSFINTGTFNSGSSTVIFNGVGGTFSISPGASSFSNINITGASTYNLTSAITLLGNLNMTDGTLDVTSSSFGITIQGNWSITTPASFVPRSGTVTFSRSGTQTISGGSFFNFVSSGSGTRTALTNLSFNNVTINSGTQLDGGSNILFVTGTWVNNSTNGFTQASAGLLQFSNTGGTQIVDNGTQSTTFNNLLFVGAGPKTIARNFSATGDVTIGASSGTVDMQTFLLTGTASKAFNVISSSTLILRAASNFPTGFGTVSLSSTSTVQYIIANAVTVPTQTIFATSYGNLTLTTTSGTGSKLLAGDITIAGALTISDVNTQLNATNRTVTLGGNFSFPAGGRVILWGTTGTFLHNGSSFNFDADYTGFATAFRNITLAGSGTKAMLANLNIAGNVVVQNGVTFSMGTFGITGAGGNFNLQGGSFLTCAILSPAIASPAGFGTYSYNITSTVTLNGAGSQVIATTPFYGNLTLSNTGTSTIQAGSDLNIQGNFSTNNSTLADNGRNINCAGNIDVRNYTPTAGTTITLNGATQYISDLSGASLDLSNVVFSNTGTKTVAFSANSIVNITGNVTINPSVTVTIPNRTVNFSGANWTNNGSFSHTGTFNFTGSAVQVINTGADNTYGGIVNFTNTGGSITFINNGGNFTYNNGATAAFVIGAGTTVNMGTLTHTIRGTITSNGTFNSSSANFQFSGTNQNFNIPGGFTANNVSISGSYTKTMGSDWTIYDLTISSGTVLTTSASNYNITCYGNWINNGTFTVNSSTVYFESIDSDPKEINSGGSSFRDVFFNNTLTNPRTYSLTNASTTVGRQLSMGSGITLLVNGNVFNLGSNNSFIETHTIASGANLVIDSNASLRFNNDNGTSVMNVSGTLTLVGNNTYPAKITRSTGTGRYQLNLLSGSTIHARYYTLEYLSDAGLNVAAGAVVDDTNNFSDGTWAYMNTASGTPKYYMVLNGTVNTTIKNVIFNFAGTPVVGTHFNVQRTTGTQVQFDDIISGVLGGFTFESDVVAASATTGLLRWPVTIDVTWTGAVNRDWNEAGNWNPAQVPTISNNVIIPLVVNNPLVTSANGFCKNLVISNGSLGLQNGFDLTVGGDVFVGTGTGAGVLSVLNPYSTLELQGSWTRGTNGNFVAGIGKVRFTGNTGTFNINSLSSPFFDVEINGPNSIFYLNGLNTFINGSLSIVDGTLIPNTSNYLLEVDGDFFRTGTFSTSLPGTVFFNGSGAQTINNGYFNNVRSGGSGVKTTQGNCVILGTLQVLSGSTFAAAAGSIWDLRGNVTMNAGSSYDDGGNMHMFTASTWTGNGNCISNTGGVRFMNNGTQTIAGGNFNRINFETGGAKLLSGNVVVNGDVNLLAGTTYLNLSTFTLNCINSLGTFFTDPSTNIYVRGTNNFPSNFGSYEINQTNNTYYDAALDQTIAGISYGNLILNNPFTKTLGENTTVKGNLTFNNATLNCSTSNYTLIVGGTYNNNSTGSFIANQGEVIFNGTGSGVQSVYNGSTGVKSFYNLTINRASGLVLQLNNNAPAVLNDLRVVSGNLDINGNTVVVGRNISNLGGVIQTSGTFVLNGTGGTGTILSSGSVLNNLTINAPGATYTALDNLSVNANFTLTAGTFDGNSMTVNLGTNNHAASISGTYKVGVGGRLGLGNGVSFTVNSGANFELIGAGASVSRVTNNSSGGRYNFIINGNIAARNYLFEYMNAGGIQINASATIDATNNMSDGTFTNGITNGTYVVLNNSQTITMENVTFSVNPGGSAKNASKTVNSGNITFNNYLGSFSGPTFENDPNNRINWTGPVILTWNGSVGTDWFNAANWTPSTGPSTIPTGNEDVVIAAATNQPVISQDGAITNKLTINQGATLTLNTPFASAPDFTILSDAFINGVFVSTGAGDTIVAKGNWVKSSTGNFIPGGSWVIFTPNSGTKTINNGSSTYNNFVLDGTATFQLGSNTIIQGNVEIKQGNLDVTATNYSITVGGSWTNSATFTSRAGLVTFNSSAASQSINNGTSRFFNLTLNGSNSTIFNIVDNDLLTSGNTQLLAGTLAMNNKYFYNGDNSGVDGFSIYGTFDMGNNGRLLNGSNASVAVNNGGLFKAVGSSANLINTITRQSTGNYTFAVNAGGTIQAQYYQFSFLNASGLQLKPGALIHNTNKLSDGIFTDGAAGGTFIDMQNSFADFTTDSVIFNSGPTYNVTRLVGTGVITFQDAFGSLSGASFENDDLSATTGLVQWIYTNPLLTWTGAVDNEWANAANWNDALGIQSGVPPSSSFNVVIPNVAAASGNFPIIKSSTGAAQSANLTINAGATVTIQEDQSLTITGTLTNLGTLTVSSGSASVITVSNLWSNTATFNAGASTVVLTASSGFKSITNGSNTFNNLAMTGGANFQTTANLTVNGNVSIGTGTFRVNSSSHTVTVGGDWTNNGTFTHNNGLVVFNKNSGTQTISGTTATTFNNLRISNTGSLNKVVALSANININGNLDITTARSSINGGTFNININGNWNNNGGVFASSGSGNVSFTGTAAQSLYRSVSAGENFNNLTINNPAGVQLLCNVTQTGNLVLTSGTLDVNTRTLTIGGNLSGSSTLSLTSGAVNLAGSNSHTGTFVKGTSTFTYSGSGSQTLRAMDYHNLASSGTGARVLSGTIGISGSFTPSTNAYTVTNSTVNFNGSSAQTIPAFNYFNLSSSSTGTRTLSGVVGIAGVFTAGTNSYAVAGSTVNFNGSAAQTIPSFQYFNLSSSSTGSRTLSNSGNIRISGSFTPGSNAYTTTGTTVEYNGSGAANQTAGGPFRYENLLINRTGAGVVNTGGVSRLLNTMTITSGTMNVSNGDSLIFVSTNTQTARLAPVTSGGITGKITMERYAPRSLSGAGWALLGSCVNDATLNDWTNNFPTSGFPGATGQTNPNFVSIYSYDETVPGNQNNGYVAPTNGTNTIVNGRGYWVYLATGYQTTTDIKFDVTGTHTVGNKNLNVSFTNSGAGNDDGWNLVANPYPSNIDWDSPSWTKTNIDPAVYVYNAQAGGMASYVSGVSTNGGSRYINSSQGFLVRATSSSPQLIATENVKTANTSAFLRQASAMEDESLLRLNLVKSGSSMSDEIAIRFNASAQAGIDPNLDAYDYMFLGTLINLSALKNGSNLSIYSSPVLEQSLMIPLRAVVEPNSTYTISEQGLAGLVSNYPQVFANDYLVLVDNNTGLEYNLHNGNGYVFSTTANQTNVDFTLRFHSPVITSSNAGVRDESLVSVLRDAGGYYVKYNFERETNFSVSVINTIGQSVVPAGSYNGQSGKVYLPMLSNLSEGVYLVNITYGNRVMTAKVTR